MKQVLNYFNTMKQVENKTTFTNSLACFINNISNAVVEHDNTHLRTSKALLQVKSVSVESISPSGV